MAAGSFSFGENKGLPLRHVRTRYLVWVCSQGHLCKLYPHEIRAALAEVRRRLNESGRVETELLGDIPEAASDLI